MGLLAFDGELACRSCPLAEFRKQVVPGYGNLQADIMLVAEAPGEVEDREGRPLIGPAGRKLDEVLEAVPLKRADVFATNIAKCRPPGNNLRPYPQAITVCPELWLEQEIAAVKPRVVVALGLTSISRWFPGEKSVYRASDLQRSTHFGYTVVAAPHPSAILHGTEWAEGKLLASLRRAKELAQR